MQDYSARFAPFAERMRAEKLPDIFINKFAYYYDKLVAGDDGLIPEANILPVESLADAEYLPQELADIGREAVHHTVIIKLNGGLGTSMGLLGPKSLLEVKEGLTFLDIIARQAIGVGAPLMLMNSYATDEESLAVLSRYPELPRMLPLSFLQHKQPKIVEADLSPATRSDDRELEWCPPGHGDLYTSLVTRGILEKLLANGYEYAFVSNADNLGAVLSLSILGYLAHKKLPFLMEVADRTAADRKGGHLARRADGQLILREIAQCPVDDLPAFQDVARHRYFNTNNLWLHLPTLQRVLIESDYWLKLPMIRNRKTVDPRDPESTPVYQLETAMGSAIAVFAGAEAIRVPRARFAPVKKTADLLAVRSDAYRLTVDYRVELMSEREGEPPAVELIGDCYRFVSGLDEHFPAGAPSLRYCDKLIVEGEFEFGRDILLCGDVHFRNENGARLIVPDGLVLENEEWPALRKL
jgi:UTP--glucose-1-phosphate uridylyltransferase